MSGVTPYRTIEQAAARMHNMNTYECIDDVPDALEYLFEVIPPGLQDPAGILATQLWIKLQKPELIQEVNA